MSESIHKISDGQNTNTGAAVKSLEKKLESKDGLLAANQDLRRPRRHCFGTSLVLAASGTGCQLHMRSVGVFASGKARERRKCLETQKPFIATLRVNESRPAKPGRQPEASLAWGGVTLTAKRRQRVSMPCYRAPKYSSWEPPL